MVSNQNRGRKPPCSARGEEWRTRPWRSRLLRWWRSRPHHRSLIDGISARGCGRGTAISWCFSPVDRSSSPVPSDSASPGSDIACSPSLRVRPLWRFSTFVDGHRRWPPGSAGSSRRSSCGVQIRPCGRGCSPHCWKGSPPYTPKCRKGCGTRTSDVLRHWLVPARSGSCSDPLPEDCPRGSDIFDSGRGRCTGTVPRAGMAGSVADGSYWRHRAKVPQG